MCSHLFCYCISSRRATGAPVQLRTIGAIPGPMTHVFTFATSSATRQIALITQIFTRTTLVPEDVRSQTHVAIFALVPQRTLAILARQPGGDALVARLLVCRGLSRGGGRRATWAAGTSGLATSTRFARCAGAAVTRVAAVYGAIRRPALGGRLLWRRGRAVLFHGGLGVDCGRLRAFGRGHVVL